MDKLERLLDVLTEANILLNDLGLDHQETLSCIQDYVVGIYYGDEMEAE